MAERIKGITVEIGGNTTELNKAIKETEVQSRSLNRELKEVNDLLKLDPGNADLVAQKQKILASLVATTKTKVDALAQAQEQVNQKMTTGDISEEQYRKFERQTIQAQQALGKFEQQAEETTQEVGNLGKNLDEAGKQGTTFGDILKGTLASGLILSGARAAGNAIKGIGTSAVETVKQTGAYADEILTLSNNTGLATDTLQELKYMQELTDVSLETVTASMARQVRSMASAQKGTKDYVNAFKSLGVAIKDGNGELRDSREVFWECIDALGQLENETERDTIAMQLYGKSAQDLNSIIKIGSAGMAEFADEARESGAVLSDDMLQTLGQADDTFQRTTQSVEIFRRKLGLAMAPAVTTATEKLTGALADMDDKLSDMAEGAMEGLTDGLLFILDNADLVASGLAGIGAAMLTQKAVSAVSNAATAFKGLKQATDAATVSQTALNVAQKASPIGLIVGLLAGLTAGIVTYISTSNRATSETQQAIKASKELRKELTDTTQAYQDNIEQIKKETDAAGVMADSLYKLADKQQKTNAEKQQMLTLIGQLNEAIPDLNLTIGEETGTLSLQREEIEQLIERKKELYLMEAQESSVKDAAQQYVASQNALDDLKRQKEELDKQIEEAKQEAYKPYGLSDLTDFGGFLGIGSSKRQKAQQEVSNLQRDLAMLEKEIAKSEQATDQAMGIYEDRLEKIGEVTETAGNAAKQTEENLTETLDNMETLGKEYAKTAEKELDKQTKYYKKGLDARVKAVTTSYDSQLKALKTAQKEEARQFDKAQKKQTETVENEAKKQVEAVEKAHKKRLELIDEEFTERLKLIDTEAYNELKALQDEIDGMEAQTEAENRAEQLRQQEAKKAELREKAATAETAEERLEASEELRQYEKDIAREREQTERTLQASILKEQKETIAAKQEADQKALEAEKQADITKSEERMTAEKERIETERKANQEALAEKQYWDKEYFDGRQEAQMNALQEEKEAALDKQRETNEDLLEKHKELQERQLEATKKRIQDEQEAAQQAAMAQTYQPANFGYDWYRPAGQTSSTQEPINYDRLAESVVSAIGRSKLKIQAGKNTIGNMVMKQLEEQW